MKPKFLFWISEELIYYCIANSLQKKIDADFFGIIESHEGIKKFMEQQKFVKFSKIWHLYDHVSLNGSLPDIEYLESIEEKYDLNIWDIGYSERLFYPKFNKYHKFSQDEILSIIEQQCKLFETVLDEIKPDFLLIGIITRIPTYFIYRLCQARKIKVITLESAKFGSRFTLSSQIDKLDDTKDFVNVESDDKTLEQLRGYLNHYKPYTTPYFGSSVKEGFKISKFKKLKAFFDFLFLPTNENYTKRYPYLGRTKFNILLKGTNFRLKFKRKSHENFFKKFCLKEIKNEPFVFFPLHYEPERELLIQAPFFNNQLALISNIARSIPVGYKLYVKEHPRMHEIGWRENDFYQHILDLPNVELLYPSIKIDQILPKCSLVITLLGTAGLEASFHRKPTIVLEETDYAVLPWIFYPSNIRDLPKIIKQALRTNIDVDLLNKYTKFVDQNSFEFDKRRYWFEFNEQFPYSGFLKDLEIPLNTMEIFLHKTDKLFEKLSDEFLKKINILCKGEQGNFGHS